MYCTRERCKELIIEAKATGTLSVELCSVITQIVSGLISKTKIKLDKEDMCQECVLLIGTRLDNFDPANNCFSYMTTICFNVLRQAHRKAMMIEKTKHAYANHLRSGGAEMGG